MLEPNKKWVLLGSEGTESVFSSYPKSRDGNVWFTKVPRIKLCLIKYELDINSFKNWLFLSVGGLQKDM